MRVMIKILRGILTIVLCVIFLLSIWMLVQQKVLKKEAPEIFGYSQYIVTSGSMEPKFSVGDLILVKKRDRYQLGDIVTFRDNGGDLVTHRITGSVSGQFITKGDADNTEDAELLSPESIVGKLQLVLPGAGEAVLFLWSPLGLLVLLAVWILLIKLPNWTGALKTKTKGKHASESQR